jgi:hypothetical protein
MFSPAAKDRGRGPYSIGRPRSALICARQVVGLVEVDDERVPGRQPGHEIEATRRIPAGLQLSHAVSQPADLPNQVGSSQTASDCSVRGPLPKASLQNLDLSVKNASEGNVGMIPLRGTLHRMNERMTTDESLPP